MRTAEANVSPTPSYVIQGRPVTMPAIVRDASTGNAIFLVPAQEAQRLVGDGYTVPVDAFVQLRIADQGLMLWRKRDERLIRQENKATEDDETEDLDWLDQIASAARRGIGRVVSLLAEGQV